MRRILIVGVLSEMHTVPYGLIRPSFVPGPDNPVDKLDDSVYDFDIHILLRQLLGDGNVSTSNDTTLRFNSFIGSSSNHHIESGGPVCGQRNTASCNPILSSTTEDHGGAFE